MDARNRILVTLLAIGLLPSAIAATATIASGQESNFLRFHERMQDYRSDADNPLLETEDVQKMLVQSSQVTPYPDYGLSNNDPYNLQAPQVPIVVEPHIPQPQSLAPLPNPYEGRFENVAPYQTPTRMWELPSTSDPGLMPRDDSWIPKWQLGEQEGAQ